MTRWREDATCDDRGTTAHLAVVEGDEVGAAQFETDRALRGTALIIDPCMPTSWPHFTIAFRYVSSHYDVTVENPNGVSNGGGFKYNPPTGGPADTDVTGWIEQTAHTLLTEGLRGVRRIPSHDRHGVVTATAGPRRRRIRREHSARSSNTSSL